MCARIIFYKYFMYNIYNLSPMRVKDVVYRLSGNDLLVKVAFQA